MFARQTLALLVLVIASFGLGRVASAAVVHDEAVNGLLSNDNMNPTVLNFSIGENTVVGNVDEARGSMNVDVFTFNVPVGAEWTSMTVDAYQSSDDVSFLAIDDTTTFPYDVFELDQVNFGGLPENAFIGGTTFGSSDIGRNILGRAGNISGSRFTPPLPSGDYTVYVQQIGSSTDYSLTFSVISAVPEPSTASAILLAGSLIAMRRRRR